MRQLQRSGVSATIGAGLALLASAAVAAPPVDPPAQEAPAKPRSAPQGRARVEAGGELSLGTDATSSATRAGGAYLGGTWSFGAAQEWPLTLRYAFLRGSVVERLPVPSGGSPTSDVTQTQTRSFFDASIGRRFRLAGDDTRVWLVPALGPRVAFLNDDAAPVQGMQAAGSLALGLSVGSGYEASTFVAYGRSIAKGSDARSIYGALVGETRFGARAVVRPDATFGLSLGYEGDVLVLEHRQLTSHGLLAGLDLRFE